MGGRQSSVRAQELQELQAVAVAQHLDVHPFAKAARASRSTLALSSYSFELLMHYLQGQRQWLVLNILNSHVRFQVGRGLLEILGQCVGRRAWTYYYLEVYM